MYYRLGNNILFREYNNYGYITDNSDFSYQSYDNDKNPLGGKYVSKSGAIMLSTLGQIPCHIDEIITRLSKIFKDVDRNQLKRDTIEFFQYLVDIGYLEQGEKLEFCLKNLNIQNLKKHFATSENEEYLLDPNDLLRSIHIELTKSCNERCIHCYITHKEISPMLEPDLFYSLIEECRNLNIINITFSGGEPLLHPKFLDFLIVCRKLNFSVNILSNLTLINDEIIYEMKMNPLLSVQTSIYSINPKIHDSVTNHEGSFYKTRNNLLKLRKTGIPIQISCPVIKQNKDCFIDVLEWGQKNGVLVAIEPLIFASYDGSKRNLVNRLSLDEFEAVVTKRILAGQAFLIRDLAKQKELLDREDPICTICRYKICVAPNGDVFPCAGWATNVIGNLNQQRLHDIWKNSEKIHTLRQIKRKSFPKCITCNDRGYCTVCIMNNSNENGDIFKINNFNCKAAAIVHEKINNFFASKEATI